MRFLCRHLDWRLRKDREFPLFGFTRLALDSNHIPAFDGTMNFVKGILPRFVRFESRHDLDLGSISPNVVEEELSLATNGGNTSCDGNEFAFECFPVGGLGEEFGGVVWESVVDVEFVRVGRGSFGFDRFDGGFAIFFVGSGVEDFFFDNLLLDGVGCFFGSLKVEC